MPNILSDAASLENLVEITEKIESDKHLPKGLKLPLMGGLLLFMLMSREKPNIDQRDLAYIEESGDFGEFKGFFRDQNVKRLFVRLSSNFIIYLGYHNETFCILYKEKSNKTKRR